MRHYDISELKGLDGSALLYEIESTATEHAVSISDAIRSLPVYRALVERLPSERLILYFQYLIKYEIYPFLRQACALLAYARGGKPVSSKDGRVYLPGSGVFLELRNRWGLKEIPVKIVHPFLFTALDKNGWCLTAKRSIKRYADIIRRWTEEAGGAYTVSHQGRGRGVIACHYVEGIDLSRRNDINWFFGNGIPPQDVLIYFDTRENKTGRPVKRAVIDEIERQGFRWVALNRGIIEGQGSTYWKAPRPSREEFVMTAAQDTLERWVLKAGNELIAQVHYWRAFHRAFGVRVHYITEQGRAVNIAQSIACDVEKERPCVFISRQRSEIYHPNICYIGFHPLHVFFVWNQRVHAYVKANYEKIKTLVVTGYPYNILRPTRENADLLRSRGAKFVIALLDNVYGPHTAYSREKMTGFYREFLRWVIEDGTVGLVIKPKKPHFFNDLVEIRCLFNAAQETGRCIKLERELGRFPSDAAAGADMAVGAGIASAVMESVISGCRGVHYDMWNRTFHEFYQWGYERLIFNDLERLVAALKRYKQDPASEPGLGDWSGHLDELDPFRDGRGGERVGAYMRWLLESLDLGKDRDEAIQYANGRYAETWGADKVIAMEKVREEAEEYRAVV